MATPLCFGGLRVRIGRSPPVYDPGGPTWIVDGRGSGRDHRSLTAAAAAAGAAQLVVPDGQRAELMPEGFEAVSDFWSGHVDGNGDARVASPDDLPFLLDAAAARRAAYARAQPVFWREAADARTNQERWFRHLLASADAQVLCLPDGFLIATRRASRLEVDDFCVVDPAHWPSTGTRLATTLRGQVQVVCACHDRPKQALMRRLGFRPIRTWFQKTIRAGETPA